MPWLKLIPRMKIFRSLLLKIRQVWSEMWPSVPIFACTTVASVPSLGSSLSHCPQDWVQCQPTYLVSMLVRTVPQECSQEPWGFGLTPPFASFALSPLSLEFRYYIVKSDEYPHQNTYFSKSCFELHNHFCLIKNPCFTLKLLIRAYKPIPGDLFEPWVKATCRSIIWSTWPYM